jgi:cobalt-precorrin 5A hydrolase
VIISDNQTLDVLITNREDVSECEASLYLKPKEYVLGIGCKKQKEPEELEAYIDETIKSQNIKPEDIYALASIDLKKDEEAIVSYSRRKNIPFVTFSAEELNQIDGDFSSSAFVKETTGVDNVCERAAIKASDGELVLPKQARDGMTIAIARREWIRGLISE